MKMEKEATGHKPQIFDAPVGGNIAEISYNFRKNAPPEDWSFFSSEYPAYSMQDHGLLVRRGMLTIPFYGKAWNKFRLEILLTPVGEEAAIICGDHSREITLCIPKSERRGNHQINRVFAGPMAESCGLIPGKEGERLAAFVFDNGSLRGFVDHKEVIAVIDPDPKPIFGSAKICFLNDVLIAELRILAEEPFHVPALVPGKNADFGLEVAVDFPDDLLFAAYDRDMFDRLFREFKSWGTKRVQWLHYQPDWFDYTSSKRISSNYFRTRETVGDVLKTAVDAAHAHGIELYGVFKPFDIGAQDSYGEGTVEAKTSGKAQRVGGPVGWMMDFVAEHPEYLMARKPGNFGPAKNEIFNQIDLVKEDDSSPALSINDIEIWVSNDNAVYQPYCGPVEKKEVIEDYPAWEHTASGGRLTGQKKRCLVFRFGNLRIPEKYIALASRKKANSFGNTFVNLIHVFGEKGEERLLTYGARPRCGDPGDCKDYKWMDENKFQEAGVEFDMYPGGPTANSSGSDGICRRFVFDGGNGFLAVARGKDRGELAAFSPSFKAARDFWLEVVRDILSAGADGVDLRFANHQWTFAWDEFGFEEPVVEEFKRRYGVDLLATDDFDRAALCRLRGAAYTQFYREAKKLVSNFGKKMGLHIEPSMSIEPEFGGPMGLHLDWRTWIKEGLADSITMKDVIPGSQFAHEILSYTRPRGLPVVYSKWNSLWAGPGNVQTTRQCINAAKQGGYDGFQFYECSAVVKGKSDGNIIMEQPALREVFRDIFLKNRL